MGFWVWLDRTITLKRFYRMIMSGPPYVENFKTAIASTFRAFWEEGIRFMTFYVVIQYMSVCLVHEHNNFRKDCLIDFKFCKKKISHRNIDFLTLAPTQRDHLVQNWNTFNFSTTERNLLKFTTYSCLVIINGWVKMYTF